MRGKGQSRYLHMPCTGITPAYAGKSILRPSFGKLNEDHPRLCGEKNAFILFSIGSNRITPAYAGKSRLYTNGIHEILDHPRLCGEKLREGGKIG